MKICFRAVVCPSGPAVLLLGSVLTWRCWLYIHCLAGRHGLGARGHQSCWGMRWSGVNKNEGQKRHKLNVGRGASDMPVVLGEVVEPRSFSGGASKHPPLPSPQTTGRESEDWASCPAIFATTHREHGQAGPPPGPGAGCITTLSPARPGQHHLPPREALGAES